MGKLEKLLDGPSVSESLGNKAVTVVSNLMDGDSGALSASANRYNSPNHHPCRNTYLHTFDFSKKCFPVYRLINLIDDLGNKLVVTVINAFCCILKLSTRKFNVW